MVDELELVLTQFEEEDRAAVDATSHANAARPADRCILYPSGTSDERKEQKILSLLLLSRPLSLLYSKLLPKARLTASMGQLISGEIF